MDKKQAQQIISGRVWRREGTGTDTTVTAIFSTEDQLNEAQEAVKFALREESAAARLAGKTKLIYEADLTKRTLKIGGDAGLGILADYGARFNGSSEFLTPKLVI